MSPQRAALLSLAAVAVACARPAVTPQQRASGASLVAPRDAIERDASERAVASEAGSADAAISMTEPAQIPALFAEVRCTPWRMPDGSSRVMFFGGVATQHGQQLRSEEVASRPWLWGQEHSGCYRSTVDGPASREDPAVLRGASAERASVIAREYLRWGRVDDEARWAPELCRMPLGARPREDVGERAPHGRKVYFLYARQREAYFETRAIDGQIVVKEAWRPREIAVSDAITANHQLQCAPASDGPCSRVAHYDYARCMNARESRCYEPGEFAGLYIMMRASRGERSDAGWTYATVSPSGDVTASGVVETCAACHRSAPNGRLFGLRRAR